MPSLGGSSSRNRRCPQMRAIKTLLVASPASRAGYLYAIAVASSGVLSGTPVVVERTNGVSALRGACRDRWPAMADRVWVAAGSSWTKPDCCCRSHSWRPRRPTLGSVPRCDGQEFVPGLASRGPRAHRPEAGGDIVHLSPKRTWPPGTAVRPRKPTIDRSLRGLNTISDSPCPWP